MLGRVEHQVGAGGLDRRGRLAVVVGDGLELVAGLDLPKLLVVAGAGAVEQLEKALEMASSQGSNELITRIKGELEEYKR